MATQWTSAPSMMGGPGSGTQKIAPTVKKPLFTNSITADLAARQKAQRLANQSAINSNINRPASTGAPAQGATAVGNVAAGIANRQVAPALSSVAGQVAGAGQTAQNISNGQIAKMAAGGGYQVERDNALFKQASGVASDQMTGNLPKGYGAGETSALDLLKQQQAQRTRATQESLASAGIANTGKAIQEGIINTGAQNDREVMGMQRDQLAARTTAQQAQIAQGQAAAQNLATMAQQGQQENSRQIITGAGVAGDLGLRAGSQRADATQTDNTNAQDTWKTNNEYNQADATRGFAKSEREAGQRYGTSERVAGQEYGTSERVAGEAYGTSERLGGETFTRQENQRDRWQQTSEREAGQIYNTSERQASETFSASESEKGRALTKLGMSSDMLDSIQNLVDSGSIDAQTASDMMGNMLNGMSAGTGGAQVYDPTTAAANRATQKTADDAAAEVLATATEASKVLGAQVSTVNAQGYGLDEGGHIIGYKNPETGLWEPMNTPPRITYPSNVANYGNAIIGSPITSGSVSAV